MLLPERIRSFQETCCDLGILPSQFEGLMKWNFESLRDDAEQIGIAKAELTKAQEAGVKSLTDNWGGEVAYKTNMELVGRVVEKFGDEGLGKLVADTSNVGLINAMHELAQAKVAEGTLINGSETPGEKSQQVASDGVPMLIDYPSMQ